MNSLPKVTIDRGHYRRKGNWTKMLSAHWRYNWWSWCWVCIFFSKISNILRSMLGSLKMSPWTAMKLLILWPCDTSSQPVQKEYHASQWQVIYWWRYRKDFVMCAGCWCVESVTNPDQFCIRLCLSHLNDLWMTPRWLYCILYMAYLSARLYLMNYFIRIGMQTWYPCVACIM